VAAVAAEMGIALSSLTITHSAKAGGSVATAQYDHFGSQTWFLHLNSSAGKAHNSKFGSGDEAYDCGILRSLAIHEMIHACCDHYGAKGMFAIEHAYIDLETGKQSCEEIEELAPDPGQPWDPEDKKRAQALCDELEALRDRWNEGKNRKGEPFDERRKGQQEQGKKNLCEALKDTEGGPPCSPSGGAGGNCPITAWTEASLSPELPDDCSDDQEVEDWEPIEACPPCEDIDNCP
jgi:hypothetical protein